MLFYIYVWVCFSMLGTFFVVSGRRFASLILKVLLFLPIIAFYLYLLRWSKPEPSPSISVPCSVCMFGVVSSSYWCWLTAATALPWPAIRNYCCSAYFSLASLPSR